MKIILKYTNKTNDECLAYMSNHKVVKEFVSNKQKTNHGITTVT